MKYLDIQQQITRLQSIVLRLASNIDTLNHQSDTRNPSPLFFESNIKHEHIEDVRRKKILYIKQNRINSISE